MDADEIAATAAVLNYTLNTQQQKTVEEVLDFIQDPCPRSWYYTISGFAGTGKTFCLREILSRCSSSKIKFALTAPTNKAARVLRAIRPDACTIFSLLKLRIDKSGELKTLVGGAEVDLDEFDVIILDEASMVNAELYSRIIHAVEEFGLKFIFLGDMLQLPPVGEDSSPVWKSTIHSTLTKVERHDNQILNLVTDIREVIPSICPSLNIRSSFDEHGGVMRMAKMDFRKQIWEAALRGDFADGEYCKVLAWRNAAVNEYNAIIRQAIYGQEALPGEYFLGERLIAGAPVVKNEQTVMATDEECVVEKITNCKHPMEPKYMAIELVVRTEYNKTVRLLVLHPASADEFHRDCELLASEARANGRLWKRYWARKELFDDMRYAYATTVHRSQGSTYHTVFVDYQDILKNRNRREAFQCLYVACSRPTTWLKLA